MSTNPMAQVFADIKAKATADTQALHDLSKAYKQASGTQDEINKWIEESEEPSVVERRTTIKNALAKVAEMKAELVAEAKAALVPEGYDSAEVSNEFKELRKRVKTFLLQSQGVLRELGADAEDVSELEEMVDNLPTIGGGITASGKSPAELQEARVWLRENGHEVADKGRISKELLTLWDNRNAA